jgi:uncharacterized protein (TIGR00255 family)
VGFGVAISSMTGFARAGAAAAGNDPGWTWEVRSVNGRGLDVRSRLPSGCEHLDAAVRTAVAKHVSRGNISVLLTLNTAEAGLRPRLNRAVLDDMIGILKELEGRIEAAPARLDGILGLRGVLDLGEAAAVPEDAKLLASLDAALSGLRQARIEEGREIERNVTSHLDEIEQLTRDAARSASAQPAAIKARLEAQFAELLGGQQTAIAPDRLAAEVALLATRADVREELDRLEAHLRAARELLRGSAAVGRKLEFLSQEFNREANTLCSKSADIELTRLGLALKASIDRLREQAANIE